MEKKTKMKMREKVMENVTYAIVVGKFKDGKKSKKVPVWDTNGDELFDVVKKAIKSEEK